jgi:hypothetical protein
MLFDMSCESPHEVVDTCLMLWMAALGRGAAACSAPAIGRLDDCKLSAGTHKVAQPRQTGDRPLFKDAQVVLGRGGWR